MTILLTHKLTNYCCNSSILENVVFLQFQFQGSVVERVYNAIHRIIRYQEDKC